MVNLSARHNLIKCDGELIDQRWYSESFSLLLLLDNIAASVTTSRPLLQHRNLCYDEMMHRNSET